MLRRPQENRPSGDLFLQFVPAYSWNQDGDHDNHASTSVSSGLVGCMREMTNDLWMGRTKTTSITTVTTTKDVCEAQKRNVPIDYRGFDYAEPVDRRDNVLDLLAAFAAAKISEGCSCFNLQPKATTTATRTAAAPVRPPTNNPSSAD